MRGWRTPETRYSRSADGVHIAYQVLGDGDIDLVVSPGFVSHLEHSWEEPQGPVPSTARIVLTPDRVRQAGDGHVGPAARRTCSAARGSGERYRHLDGHRGVGESGDDGALETGAVALMFAATHPERTTAVIAYGSFAGDGALVRHTRGCPIQRPRSGSWTSSKTGAEGALTWRIRLRSSGDKRYRGVVRQARATVGESGGCRRVGSDADPNGRPRHPPKRCGSDPCPSQARRQAVPIEEGRYIADHFPGRGSSNFRAPTTGRGSATKRPSTRSRSSSPECAKAPSQTEQWRR